MQQSEGRFVALIPDGGRRAVNNDKTKFKESYERGADVIGDILKACVNDSRIKVFAAWGLSDDNATRRSTAELMILNQLFHTYLNRLSNDLETEDFNTVRVVHVGDSENLHPKVHRHVMEVVDQTKDRTDKIFALCLGHGGVEEMHRAAIEFAVLGKGKGDWRRYLDLPKRSGTQFQPVDVIVRTGTKPEDAYTSGYLLGYRDAHTQERFIPKYLPNTTADDFMRMVDATLQSKTTMRSGA